MDLEPCFCEWQRSDKLQLNYNSVHVEWLVVYYLQYILETPLFLPWRARASQLVKNVIIDFLLMPFCLPSIVSELFHETFDKREWTVGIPPAAYLSCRTSCSYPSLATSTINYLHLLSPPSFSISCHRFLVILPNVPHQWNLIRISHGPCLATNTLPVTINQIPT